MSNSQKLEAIEARLAENSDALEKELVNYFEKKNALVRNILVFRGTR